MKVIQRVYNKIVYSMAVAKSNSKIIRASKIIKQMEHMPDFPSSACSQNQFINLTLEGGSKTYGLILKTTGAKEIPIIDIENYTSRTSEKLIEKIGTLLSDFGSDKSTHHNYHKIYAEILHDLLGKETSILEIGLGSNYSDTPSNMGKLGRPGASIKAWKNIDEKFTVYGADVDSRVLFTEDRIHTFKLDQTSESSWQNFLRQIGKKKFSLIIDDGLHSPNANLNSILHLVSLLEQNGTIVIEDIPKRAIPIWSLLYNLAPDNWKLDLIQAKNALILVLRVIER